MKTALSRMWDTPGVYGESGDDTPLSAAERDRLLNTLVGQIVKRGLQTPVLWAIEMHRPLAFTAGQTLVALTPLLGPLLGANRMEQAARLLSEPGIVDELTVRLEQAQASEGKPD